MYARATVFSNRRGKKSIEKCLHVLSLVTIKNFCFCAKLEELKYSHLLLQFDVNAHSLEFTELTNESINIYTEKY